MPPVEFDSIPRFASSGVKVAKYSTTSANDVLELGSFKPVLTRSKGVSPKDDGTIKDVEVPEVDSEDETTIDKLLKDYSEDESEDSDYVPSEDSEEDQDSTENDFVITRSKGFLPEDSGFVQDVDIPEIDSEDETTIVKLMKDYSDAEEVEADSDYIPYEDSEEDLEYDSNASISDDECETEQIEDVDMPTFDKKISNVVINDVNIPPVSNVVIKDVPVGQTDDDAWSQFSTIATNVMDLVADNPIVQAGIKTLDYGLELSEKIFTPYKEHVQNARRHLRAIRRSGSSPPRDGLVATLIQLFKVKWFLSLIGVSVTVEKSVGRGRQGFNYGIEEQEDSEDEESTVYKLMKEYDSQDDEDYVPVYCSEDSMEFDSDSSDDETIVEKIMKDYSDDGDFDYIPSDEDSEDELEYDSDAEISDDSDYDSSDVEDCSEDETILEKLLKDYSEDESDFDGDYIPGEEVDGDIEYDSEASITECSEEDSEDVSESDEESDDAESEESCSEVEEHEIVEEDSQEMDEGSQETEDEESQEAEDE